MDVSGREFCLKRIAADAIYKKKGKRQICRTLESFLISFEQRSVGSRTSFCS